MADEDRTITLIRDSAGWTVREGDRYQDQLGSDEALWVIAVLLCGGERRGYTLLKTEAEHMAARERWPKASEVTEGGV